MNHIKEKTLNENQVIKAVVKHLKAKNWHCVSVSYTNQRGIDILMELDGVKFAIEAKGGTSSKSGTFSKKRSRRFGQPFNNNQKVSHVSRALYTAVRTVCEKQHRAGIAVPCDKEHKRLIEAMLPALRTLEITVFLVRDDGTVKERP